VQQSSYALLGDFAIFAYPQLKPFLPQIMPELMTRIDPNMDAMYQSVCINAIWAVGEIALQTGAEMAHWAPPLLERLIAILCGPPMTRTLLENVAITIGRLGVVVPELIAPHLETFGQPWCKHTRALLDNAEKETAFLGMCRMIQTNPSGMFRHFSFFCDAVALWQTPSPELATEFAQIFKGFREM
ncbi:ARM repeat-containing protein, partial [Caulochytrium protostelioides]